MGDVKARSDQHGLNNGVGDWLYDRNRQSSIEATNACKQSARRRGAMGGLLRFVANFIFRGGWLRGTVGFHDCLMIAMYDYWTELKTREAKQPWRERTEALVARRLREAKP